LGIVKLVNAGLSSPPSTIGGFFVELPKDQPLPSWTYLSAGQTSDTTLTSSKGLNRRRLQIDCYGTTAAEAITLGAEIDAVLNGYAGRLPDPDATFVSSCLSTDVMDFFDDARRSYRRMLEYEILFAQS